MARPLEPSSDWRGPVALSTAGAVLVILLLSLTRSYGWIGLTVLVILLWAGFLVTVWVPARPYCWSRVRGSPSAASAASTP